MPTGKPIVITKMLTNGGPCGDGCEVAVEAVSRHKTKVRCTRCGKERVVKIPHGKIDLVGFAKLENAVLHLHDADA